MADTASRPDRKPWIFVPTLYFAEGLPYIVINSVSVIMYKNLGASNQFVGLTALFMWPWVIKMLWAPLVDTQSTKRNWIVYSELLLGTGLFLLAAFLQFNFYILASIIVFSALAFVSATHDIAIDGYYMLSLSEKMQSLYVGVRSTFYRIAVIFGSGFLVVLAGLLQKRSFSMAASWQVVMGFTGLLFLIMFLFHRFYLPYPENTIEKKQNKGFSELFDVFVSYFKQEKVWIVVLFILLYRLGEAVLEKMSPAFLLDSVDAGGLGLATETVGMVKGTMGVLMLTIGGILGGWLISKFGLKKCLWPMALMLKLPDVVYIYMSIYKPSLALIYVLVGFEQFGYGIGFTAFMVFLMYFAKEPYKTSHYAISTGIMALGMMLPGVLSGFLQQQLGYTWFFVSVLLLTVPGLLMLFFIPIENE